MYDYRAIQLDGVLKYKFKRTSPEEYKAIDIQSGEVKGKVTITGSTFDASDEETFFQYKLWQVRPESKVGKPVEIAGKNMGELLDTYEELLVGAVSLEGDRTGQRYAAAIEWLRTTDFYTCPASTQYHEAFPSGLLVHTLTVYNRIAELLKLSAFKSVEPSAATLVALTHDWCKIASYETYQKNVKDEKTGKWVKETAYRKNQKGVPLGHGTSSMFLASRFFHLSVDEALAIRWHMGAWYVTDSEVNELQKANETCPLVHLIQFADQLAITDYAIKED